MSGWVLGRKTGHRWHAERGGISPIGVNAATVACLLERERIACLLERGYSIREIGRQLGRAPSTVISRSTPPQVREGEGIFAREEGLRLVVQAELLVRWSPQQIAFWLKSESPDRAECHVCHETIYQAIYFGGGVACRGS